MTRIESVIEQLVNQAGVVKPLPGPHYWIIRIIAVLAIYGSGIQYFLGLRADIAGQMLRPFFVAEIVTLLALTVISAIAAIYALYPDAYQRAIWLKLPFIVFAVLVVLLGVQFFVPLDLPAKGSHTMECALCIACVAILPATILFMVLSKAVSVRPLTAGLLAVLTAAAVGCLTLRLAEVNDSLSHLIIWHYIPMVFFAAFGALIGKFLLKW